MIAVHYILISGLAALSFALCSCSDNEPTSVNTPAPDTEEVSDVTEEAGQGEQAMVETEDALVPGTHYHATTQIECSFANSPDISTCAAGVIRKWGEDGTTLVEVTKPGGAKRAIFFNGSTAYSADSAQADGSAGFDFKVERQEDNSIITYGPERYVVPDALVLGG